MCGPPAPTAEPEPRDTPRPPAFSAGQVWNTVRDWYERQRNRYEVLQGNKYKWTYGFTVKMGMNTRSELVYGWNHGTVIGASFSQVVGFENKLNIGFVANFIRREKTETTKGNKSEYIALGVKFAHVSGKKNKFVGAGKINNSDLAKKQLKVKVNEYWATLDKMLTQEYRKTVKDLSEEHEKLEGQIRKMEQDIKFYSSKGDKYVEKTNTWIGDIRKHREECDAIDTSTKAKFEIVSSAAAEFKADGEFSGSANGDAKMMADSLISFAGSIIKLG